MIPLIDTVPVPFPESSRSAFDAFVEMVLSFIITPSKVALVFAVTVVNVPAAGVVAPIVVLSIAPPLMSVFAITILPVPEAVNLISELDTVVINSLSVMLMF